MNGERLEVAFEPACPLREPEPQSPGRGFVGGTPQDAQASARAPDAETEISVFRHVPGIPAAQGAKGGGAEMIAGSAEWKGQAKRHHGRKRDLKEGRIFRRELGVAPSQFTL